MNVGAQTWLTTTVDSTVDLTPQLSSSADYTIFVRLQQRTSDSVTAHEQALTSKSAPASGRTRETAALIYCSSECTRTRGPSRHVTRDHVHSTSAPGGQSASMRVSRVTSAACARRCTPAPAAAGRRQCARTPDNTSYMSRRPSSALSDPYYK